MYVIGRGTVVCALLAISNSVCDQTCPLFE
jgi:hypothetical protein